MDYILLASDTAGPFHYLLLFLGLAGFGYLFYRHRSASSESVNNIIEFAKEHGYSFAFHGKEFSGEINGYPFNFGQVVEHQYGNPARFVKLNVTDIPRTPHIEVAVKKQIGYSVVHTIWNVPPFATFGNLILFTHDRPSTRILLDGGLKQILKAHSESDLQIFLADNRLTITSSSVMKHWTQEDIEEAISLATAITGLLKRREEEGLSYS